MRTIFSGIHSRIEKAKRARIYTGGISEEETPNPNSNPNPNPNSNWISEEKTSQPYSCGKVYGVDVLIDVNLRPYTLEVNASPDMGFYHPLDRKVKGDVMQGIPKHTWTYPLIQPLVVDTEHRPQS